MNVIQANWHDERTFVLRVVQPALVGLIDGTISTLAPVFATAFIAGSHAALLVGLATAIGAGISMGLSEGLSDDGTLTGRGSGDARGAITGLATTFGGTFHALPFIISDRNTAVAVGGRGAGAGVITTLLLGIPAVIQPSPRSSAAGERGNHRGPFRAAGANRRRRAA